MVRCPNCDKDNPDKQKICFWCRSDLPKVEVPRAEKPTLPVETRIPPAGEYAPEEEFTEKRGVPWGKIVVLVLVVAIVGVAGHLIVGGMGNGGTGEGGGEDEGETTQISMPPVYPGASELSSGEDWASYSVSASGSAVRDWYRSEMAARGWTKGVDTTKEIGGMGTVFILAYTKGGAAAMIDGWLAEPSGFFLRWGPEGELEGWLSYYNLTLS